MIKNPLGRNSIKGHVTVSSNATSSLRNHFLLFTVFQSWQKYQKFVYLNLAICSQTLFISIIHATPYIPKNDSVVLQTLPVSKNFNIQALRKLRNKLITSPTNLVNAVELAREYLQAGRTMADPRYDGYAQAVLQPWWHMLRPPPEVLILRATLRQRQHDFDRALNDLNQVLQLQPNHAQAWLTQSVIHQVRGHYQAAQQSCYPLLRLANTLIATTCLTNVAGLNGRAEESYQALKRTIETADSSSIQEKLWALTILAETAMRIGKYSEAEQHFQQALRIDRQDTYLLGAYSDYLLDQGRPEDVQTLLQEVIQSDGLLLRIALAEQQLNAPTLKQHVEILKARFVENKLRGESQHLREEARFTLHLLHKPKQALTLAQENWRVQREPWDARLLLEAALSSADQAAAKPVIDWLASVNLEDHQLNRLREQLP